MVEKKRQGSIIGTALQLDSILEELGNFGRYQFINYVLIVIPIVLSGLVNGAFIFTAADEPYRCKIPECDGPQHEFEPSWLPNAIPYKENTFETCTRYSSRNSSGYKGEILNTCPSDIFNSNQTVKCDSWVYRDRITVSSEFDLGCELWKRTLVGTVSIIGQFFGMPLAGFLSDRYGRRTALVAGAVFSGIFGVVMSFSPDYWTFLFLNLLVPILGSGVYSSAYILGIELVGPRYRVLGSTIISSFYAVGETFLGLSAWYFPYWRVLYRIIYIPSILMMCYIWIISESVRWLMNKGKTEMAGKILAKAAKINGKILSEDTLQKLYRSAENDSNHKEIQTTSNLAQVFKSKILLIRLVCCCGWWVTCTFVFYGLSLNSVSIAGNSYLNYILVSLIEIPGYITYYFCMNRFGRRITLCTTFLGSGIACVAFAFVPDDIGWLKMIFYLFGKFSITIAFTAVYVYTTELFPTPVRHSLQSICSMFGRIGSMVAPQMPILSIFFKPLPLLLFGATSAISGFSILAFPETSNIRLPDTIEEAENISKKKQDVDWN